MDSHAAGFAFGWHPDFKTAVMLLNHLFRNRQTQTRTDVSCREKRQRYFLHQSRREAVAFVAAGVLFIVSGTYLFARFYAVRQIVVLEDAGVVRALGRASDLSKGLRLHIIGTLFLIGVLTIAVDVGVTLMLGMIPSPVLIRLGSTALAVIVGPLFGITETVLYYDLRIRKEAFDVEYLAAAVEPSVIPA